MTILPRSSRCPSDWGVSGSNANLGEQTHSRPAVPLLSLRLPVGRRGELRAHQCSLPPCWRDAGGSARHSINPSRQGALGLGTGAQAHLSWGLSCPFPLPQAPGEARCPGQVTFSRSVARMPGNKSYPRAGNQCRARKPGLRGAEQMEGEQLSWGREDPPSGCGKCRSHGAHHLL